ncbi:hypothetical protein AB1Y20_014940 [Prymnesium parvum]|uniref:Methyltransferase type 12 domain-containing protein n=1 Tax=Prymnesium parvum TaxID=97485 RepID=A0AB34JVA6_PRYPA
MPPPSTRRPRPPPRPPRASCAKLPAASCAALAAALALAACARIEGPLERAARSLCTSHACLRLAASLARAARPAAAAAPLERSLAAAAAREALARGEAAAALEAVQTAIELSEAGVRGGGGEREAAAALHLLKGRVLEALPPRRCAAGSCPEHAANAYRTALQLSPGLAEAAAALDAVSATLRGASAAYVRSLFDEYAARFDESLHRLEYQAPALVGRALAAVLSRREGGLPVERVLDAGCGTGLSGLELRQLAVHLAGVDLSAGMIARARERTGLYDALKQSELVEYLVDVQQGSTRFDAIVCADVLNYFADLTSVLRAVAGSLVRGGLLAFTLEASPLEPDSAVEWQWKALPSGRYAHNVEWVVSLAAQAGLQLVQRTPVPKLRLDGGRAVPGNLIILSKREALENSEASVHI